MESLNVAETIKAITKDHLENRNGMLLGQCVSAVGWVNNTIPDTKNIVELPMTDVAAAGIVSGAALMGRRPIFVVRFQDFMILNGSALINFAAKSKELHGVPCPVFIRALASEGLGPCHSGTLHSIFMHFPGFRVYAPMTPSEYREVWKEYMEHDDPVFCSEHRDSFKIAYDNLRCRIPMSRPVLTVYTIGAARINTFEACRILLDNYNIQVNVVPILRLKPLDVDLCEDFDQRFQPKKALIIDSGYNICGAAQAVADYVHEETGWHCYTMGVKDQTKCYREDLQNATPSVDAIIERVLEICKK